jgi:hypothetical protein
MALMVAIDIRGNLRNLKQWLVRKRKMEYSTACKT